MDALDGGEGLLARTAARAVGHRAIVRPGLQQGWDRLLEQVAFAFVRFRRKKLKRIHRLASFSYFSYFHEPVYSLT
jgi:hypothetical protein